MKGTVSSSKVTDFRLLELSRIVYVDNSTTYTTKIYPFLDILTQECYILYP